MRVGGLKFLASKAGGSLNLLSQRVHPRNHIDQTQGDDITNHHTIQQKAGLRPSPHIRFSSFGSGVPLGPKSIFEGLEV